MGQKTSTLQDVARVAGVSTATVSRTLSHPNVVSESTRTRVAEAVKSTGYRINRAARNLRTQRTQTILVLLPDLANPFFSSILEGISRHLSNKQYSMLITSTKQVYDSGENIIDYLEDARADGMIILDGDLPQDVVSSLETAPQSNRVLFACEWINNTSFPSVRSENHQGTCIAVRHLHSLGHKKIGHVAGPEGNVLSQARKDAFKAEVSTLDLEHKDEWIVAADFSLSAGCVAAQTWLLAVGFIAELSRNGLEVPQEVSVMGFDDIDHAEQFIPPLTTIKQDRLLLGQTAATMLLERIEAPTNPAHVQTAVLPVSLVVRGSTARI